MSLPNLPPLSGDVCIRALVSSGWLPAAWSERACSLIRGDAQIEVPRHCILNSDALAGLLERGRVFALEFILALERVYEHDLRALREAHRSGSRAPAK